MNQKIRRNLEARKRKIANRLKSALDRPTDEENLGPVMSAQTVHYELASRTQAIAAGGIGAIHLLVRRLGLPQRIDAAMQVVKFSVIPPPNWTTVLAARVARHFDLFKLSALYSSNAATELANIRWRLKQLFEGGGADALEVHLKGEAESRRIHSLNSWQTAMYAALAGNQWYRGGGFDWNH